MVIRTDPERPTETSITLAADAPGSAAALFAAGNYKLSDVIFIIYLFSKFHLILAKFQNFNVDNYFDYHL